MTTQLNTSTSPLLQELRGGKTLLVASTGGHLAQLHRIAEQCDLAEGSTWVTFDSPQSASLLDGERREFVDYVAPRDYRGVLRSWRFFNDLLRRENFDSVVSTGAGVALASHLCAASRGYHPIYIESVSRFDGPSLTGRLLSRVPQVRTYCQHAAWKSARWRHEFSVLDLYSSVLTPPAAVRRVFVTLGTIRPYRFDALVNAVKKALPSNVAVTWQLGETDRRDLPGSVHQMMSADQFTRAASEADVVITHAGVGTPSSSSCRMVPTLAVPRDARRGEHVDDHQFQVARELSGRQLITSAQVDDLDEGLIRTAAGRRPSLDDEPAVGPLV